MTLDPTKYLGLIHQSVAPTALHPQVENGVGRALSRDKIARSKILQCSRRSVPGKDLFRTFWVFGIRGL